jgi:ribosome-associated translation inhibitor RaiA
MSLQLTFRRMANSVALATHVRRRAEKLEHVFGRIVSCHVVIDLAGHHHRHGNRYRISINLALPGRELLVSRAPAAGREIESAHASADRAFDEAERQLEDWVRRRRACRHEVRRSA